MLYSLWPLDYPQHPAAKAWYTVCHLCISISTWTPVSSDSIHIYIYIYMMDDVHVHIRIIDTSCEHNLLYKVIYIYIYNVLTRGFGWVYGSTRRIATILGSLHQVSPNLAGFIHSAGVLQAFQRYMGHPVVAIKLGVPKLGLPRKWFVYKGKSHENGWFLGVALF